MASEGKRGKATHNPSLNTPALRDDGFTVRVLNAQKPHRSDPRCRDEAGKKRLEKNPRVFHSADSPTYDRYNLKKKKSVIERRHVKMVTFNLVERPSYGLVRVLVYVLAVFPSSLPLSLSLSLARSKVQTPINKSDKTQGDVGKLSEKLQL